MKHECDFGRIPLVRGVRGGEWEAGRGSGSGGFWALGMARERLKALEEERRVLEAEAADLTTALHEAAGEAGVTGRLVDKEGFPIPDVDLHQVRLDRKRLAEIRTDHTRLTNALAEALAELHASAPPSKASAPRSGPRSAPAGLPGEGAVKWGGPFALVTDVAMGSPAATAGLAAGDQICKMGGVMELADVARVVSEFEGRPLLLEVLRRGTEERLELVPHKWAGAGLLGCQLRPL